MNKFRSNQSGFSTVEALLILVIVGVLGFTGWYVYHAQRNTNNSYTPTSSVNPTFKKRTGKTPSSSKTNPYAGWKTFNSSAEKFSIKYPSNWTVMPSSDSVGDRYDFQSPDGLIVRYVELGQGTTDSPSCGHQSACPVQKVVSISDLSILNYQNVKLVKTAPDDENNCFSEYLDLPSGASTTPKIGDNSYSDHFIYFSLPSKNGGRFELFITNSRAGVTTFKCSGMTQESFFATTSVQQADGILRSISY